MKILVLCDQGNNRSVTFAHLLKYWGHDVIAAGLGTNSEETLDMLYEWANYVIFTEKMLYELLSTEKKIEIGYNKSKIFDVGPDTYPRPFNKELLVKVKSILEENKSWLQKKIKKYVPTEWLCKICGKISTHPTLYEDGSCLCKSCQLDKDEKVIKDANSKTEKSS